jgi:hypothetical protein
MREFTRHNAGIPIRIIHNDDDLEYILENVSLGGLACQGSLMIPVKTPVEIRMYLLLPEYVSQGRVVWCKKSDDLFELGIEHSGDRDKTRLHMIEQISNIEHYRNEIMLAEGRNLDGEQAAREWVDVHGADFLSSTR